MSTLIAELDVTELKPEAPHGTPALTRWMVLIASGAFAFTMSQPSSVLRLPFQHLLKSDLHVTRAAMASFFALGALAWYFKPLAGILSDSVPLFGTRRRYYLILSSAAAGVLYLLLGVVPHTYTALLIGVIALNVMLVLISAVIGGVMVEVGQRDEATGRLTSVFYFVQNACILIGGPLGGYLAARAFGFTAAAGALISLSVIPFAWWFLREPPTARRNTAAWTNAKAEFRTLLGSGPLWAAAGLVFLFYVIPGFNTPLYYHQTDTLKLSQQYIGTLIMLGGGFGLLSSLVYSFLCSRLTLRWLLGITMVASALGALSYLFYHSAKAAAVIESENGFLSTLAVLALIDLALRATPRGSEGLGFALMMSVQNGAMALSDIAGSWLIDHHYVTFFNLVWLNAATTALVLVAIPFLPRLLIDRADGMPASEFPLENNRRN